MKVFTPKKFETIWWCPVALRVPPIDSTGIGIGPETIDLLSMLKPASGEVSGIGYWDCCGGTDD